MFGRDMYFDKRGRPITIERWGELHGSGEEYARIGSWHGESVTVEGTWWGHLWVSTVWLGINHNFMGDGPPVIFETMVFPDNTDLIENYCMRYSTEEEAIEGHQHTVSCLERGRMPFAWMRA